MKQRIDSCFYEQRPPWCSTDEASLWISQQLELLVFHIACIVLTIAMCWCWQCLLTVGGNLLPHIVTILGVAAVAWCYRQTQDVLHPAECPTRTLQTSQWQWTASVFSTWHCTGSSLGSFTADKCLQNNLILWFGCWTSNKVQKVNCYCPLVT
jgi:hypothetical protein